MEGFLDEGLDPSAPAIPPPPASGVRLRGASAEPTAEVEDEVKDSALTSIPPAQLRRFIDAYLPLVQRQVKQLRRRLPAHVQHDDLIAAGVFGLVDSLRRNGGDQGVTFPWYARTRIRGAIFDELRAQDWLSRRARDRADASGDAEGLAAVFVSLDDMTGPEASDHLSSAEDDPFDAAQSHCQQRALARAIEQLPDRERQIVGRHYFDGVKLKDLCAELGVSEPRISQLHTRALGRLRAMLA